MSAVRPEVKNMLQLRNIKKDYMVADTRVHALKGINLEFRESEFVAILGHSGCGKTTLLNILTGQLEDYSGEILINGVDMRKCNLNSLRECFSYVTQNAFLFSCSVLENVKIGNFKIYQ